jgi:hypothetical protein
MVWEGRQTITGIHHGKRHRGFVMLGDSAVPPEALLTFEGTRGSPDVSMNFEIRDGRPECVGITVKAKPDGRGIRSADLALFNIDSLTIGVFAQLANFGVNASDEKQLWQTIRNVTEARTARRGAVTQAELEEVARVYRDHIDAAPTRAVETLLGYTERTAARRVQQARAAGLLPKTTPGKRQA